MAHQHLTDIFLNSFSDSTPTDQLDTSTYWNIQTMLGFSQDTFFTPHINTNLSPNMLITTTTTVSPGGGGDDTTTKSVVPATATSAGGGTGDHLYRFGSKRKSLDTPESSSANSFPLASSSNGVKNSAAGKGKKQKCNAKKNDEKPNDVVHVRARRGQATDSHSLAERVRRGKINERLRCLQDIVPGCQKTVGMAAMLDEIINYVQSLQNQVEFLSMKLTAASHFHDFNTEETNTMNFMMIQRAKAYEAGMMMQKLMELGIGGGDVYPSTQQHGPFDHYFGSFPTLPNNK